MKEDEDLVSDDFTSVNNFEALSSSECAYACKECERVETNEIDLEIHEFLKHTSFGVQLEEEIENCKIIVNLLEVLNSLYLCSICGKQAETSDSLMLHFLDEHCSEIVIHINNW